MSLYDPYHHCAYHRSSIIILSYYLSILYSHQAHPSFTMIVLSHMVYATTLVNLIVCVRTCHWPCYRTCVLCCLASSVTRVHHIRIYPSPSLFSTIMRVHMHMHPIRSRSHRTNCRHCRHRPWRSHSQKVTCTLIRIIYNSTMHMHTLHSTSILILISHAAWQHEWSIIQV